MDKATVKKIRTEMQNAMNEVAKKYGFEATIPGTLYFESTGLRGKFELREVRASGEVYTAEARAYDKLYDLGRVTVARGTLLKGPYGLSGFVKVIGYVSRARRYKFIVEYVTGPDAGSKIRLDNILFDSLKIVSKGE